MIKIKIYGLFERGTDNCLYVGRTKNAPAREKAHRNLQTTGDVEFDFRIIKQVDSGSGAKEEGESIRFFKSKGQASLNKRLILKPSELIAFLRDRSVVWYGPHECNGCGATVVKSSNETGGVSLDAPHGHHYPNHKWIEHRCTVKQAPQ
jgi:hypothetical protein